MTLIAAFRCAEGVVLCADSQETVDIPERGQYRVRVNKIQPQEVGEYQFVIGGSGDGPLIDGFKDAFVEDVVQWQPSLNRSAIKTKIRKLLHDYHRNEIALSTVYEDDKHLSFIICVKQKGGPDVFLWKSVGPTIREVTDLALLGWEEPLYWHEASRLYRPEAISSEAILLAVHLFSLAKKTSNVISGETKVILARQSGMRMLDSENVSELEQRLTVFSQMSDTILLTLPNVSIPPRELRSYLKEFQQTAILLHLQFMARAMMAKLEKMKGLGNPASLGANGLAALEDDPYLQLPSLEDVMFTEDDEDWITIKNLAKAYKRKASGQSPDPQDSEGQERNDTNQHEVN